MPIRFQVDPDFYDHPKTIGMSADAFKLWVRAGSFSAAKLTDGFVSEDVLADTLRTEASVAEELVRRRLWRRVKGGYKFHEWSPRNLTKHRVQEDQKADRERKAREREAARNARGLNGSAQATAAFVRTESDRSPPGIQTESEGIPASSVSVSVSKSVSVSGSGRGSPAAGKSPPPRPEEPPTRCPEHERDLDPPRCGACASARKAHDAWQRALGEWEKTMGEWDRTAPRCRRHPTERAHNCRSCAADRKAAA